MELENLGHTVLYAEDTLQALVHLRSCPVDLVILDDTGNEDQTSDVIQKLTRADILPPFVLTSSYPSAPMLSAKLGAAAFWPKPCLPTELGYLLARMPGAN